MNRETEAQISVVAGAEVRTRDPAFPWQLLSPESAAPSHTRFRGHGSPF